MILLNEIDYYKAEEALEKVDINKLFAVVVAKRIISGKIYVDDVSNPSTFYIIHPYGMSLLIGNTENQQFNQALQSYLLNQKHERQKVEWLQVFPDLWYKKMETLLGANLIKSEQGHAQDNSQAGKVIQNTRVNFVFNQAKYLANRAQFTPDKESKIIRTDEKIFSDESGSVIPKYFWNDAQQFLEMGLGFSLIYNTNGSEVAAATAYSSYIVGNMFEIGIETKVQYHGKGFGAVVSSYLINYCLKNGLEPVWSCRLENIASYKLAQKLGFEPVKYLPYYKLN